MIKMIRTLHVLFHLSDLMLSLPIIGIYSIPVLPRSEACMSPEYGVHLAADALGVSVITGSSLASTEAVDAVLFPNVHALIDAASRTVVIETALFQNLFVVIFSSLPALLA